MSRGLGGGSNAHQVIMSISAASVNPLRPHTLAAGCVAGSNCLAAVSGAVCYANLVESLGEGISVSDEPGKQK